MRASRACACAAASSARALRDLFAARPGFQSRRASRVACARLRAHRFGAGARAVEFELQQRLAGLDLLPFAHVDRDDPFGRGRRQGDAVVFERAQRLRRVVAAGGERRRSVHRTSSRGRRVMGRARGQGTPMPGPAGRWRGSRMATASMSSASNRRRQIGAPAAGNRVRPTSDTTSRRGSSSRLSWPSACACAKLRREHLRHLRRHAGRTASRAAHRLRTAPRAPTAAAATDASATVSHMPRTKPAITLGDVVAALERGVAHFANAGITRSAITACCSCPLSPK